MGEEEEESLGIIGVNFSAKCPNPLVLWYYKQRADYSP